MRGNMNRSMFFKNVGAYIRSRRIQKKRTQTEIARVLNVTFQQIQKYEKGTNEIGLWYFSKVVQHFGDDLSRVISDCYDNLFLPEELVKQGYITVSSEEIAKDPTKRLDPKHWIQKKADEHNE